MLRPLPANSTVRKLISLFRRVNRWPHNITPLPSLPSATAPLSTTTTSTQPGSATQAGTAPSATATATQPGSAPSLTAVSCLLRHLELGEVVADWDDAGCRRLARGIRAFCTMNFTSEPSHLFVAPPLLPAMWTIFLQVLTKKTPADPAWFMYVPPSHPASYDGCFSRAPLMTFADGF
jgi:hypothetical protein